MASYYVDFGSSAKATKNCASPKVQCTIVEEDMFKRYEYPQSKTHIEEHNKFAATAALLLSKYESGESVNNEALDFLKEWLKHHIMKVDMAYVPFLKEKGIN